jgi:hypothetical protein
VSAFRPLRATALAATLGVAGPVAFVLLALEPRDGVAAAFAASFLSFVVAACAGPCCFGTPGAAAWRCGAIGACGAVACGAVALARGGPVGAALLCGLFSGLFAFALGAAADALGGGVLRVAATAAGLALLSTLLWWDGAFLLDAADRKASAALAFRLNPAAGASVTLGFDWLHAKALYTGNETAESMLGVPLPGIGSHSLKLAAVGGLGALAGWWRRR